jgi:hypothetical protein
LLHVGVCRKWASSRVLVKWSICLEITVREVGTVMVHSLPPLAPKPHSIPVGTWVPVMWVLFMVILEAEICMYLL